MPTFQTPAVLLRRVDFGDYDVIATFFSFDRGKVSAIAKSAKKSAKRFAGVLELFSALEILCSAGRGKGLPVLQEASVVQPFSKIRLDIIKTAYASYWAEMIYHWTEEGEKQKPLYRLLIHVLDALNSDRMQPAALSILFQMRFLTLSGYSPEIDRCSFCRMDIEKITDPSYRFDLGRGGIVCSRCVPDDPSSLRLHIGTIKQLQWIRRGELEMADRIRFTAQALSEGLSFLEAFAPYHLGKTPHSLSFLQQIRK